MKAKPKHAGTGAKAAAARSKARIKREQQPLRRALGHALRQQPAQMQQQQQQQQQQLTAQGPYWCSESQPCLFYAEVKAIQAQERPPTAEQVANAKAFEQMQQQCPMKGMWEAPTQHCSGRKMPHHSASNTSNARDPFAGLCEFQAAQRLVG